MFWEVTDLPDDRDHAEGRKRSKVIPNLCIKPCCSGQVLEISFFLEVTDLPDDRDHAEGRKRSKVIPNLCINPCCSGQVFGTSCFGRSRTSQVIGTMQMVEKGPKSYQTYVLNTAVPDMGFGTSILGSRSPQIGDPTEAEKGHNNR